MASQILSSDSPGRHSGSRARVLIENGLRGAEGARAIISELRKRPSVVRLLVGHNPLGDDGCVELFDFLCANRQRADKIEEMALNATRLGNRGLIALSRYLHNNQHVRALQLQYNSFDGDTEAISTFTTSLNTSRVRSISFSNNQQLSDAFLHTFLSTLTSPALEEVYISSIGLTPASVPLLDFFLRSPRCAPSLKTFTLNGNSLGFAGTAQLVRTAVAHNFRLRRLELTLNWALGSGVWDEWKVLLAELKRALARNEVLASETRRQALRLLFAARAALLRSGSDCSALSLVPRRLPPELVFHVLEFLAPTLSPMQRIRVFDYAADPRTLPAAQDRGTPPVLRRDGSLFLVRSPYEETRAAQERWLLSVGCDVFERQD